MKKFIALIVVLCAVMISSTAAAATTMANWKFVKDDTFILPPNPRYSMTPEQFWQSEYDRQIMSGASPDTADRRASRAVIDYKPNWLAEQQRLANPQPQKTASIYIDLNSIGVDQTNEGGVAFHVVVRYDYTAFGRELLIADLKSKGKSVPADLEKISFIVSVFHFKSTNGITKYCALTDSMAFTYEGNTIEYFTLSNVPISWTFINPGDNFDKIFDAAYSHL